MKYQAHVQIIIKIIYLANKPLKNKNMGRQDMAPKYYPKVEVFSKGEKKQKEGGKGKQRKKKGKKRGKKSGKWEKEKVRRKEKRKE